MEFILARHLFCYFKVHHKHVKHNCQNLLHLAKYTDWNFFKKKLNKPIRMQTASITTLNTNFRSMTTSIEIQPTLQANCLAYSWPSRRSASYSHMTLLPVKVKVEKCQQTTANCTTGVYFVRLQIYRTLKQEYCIR